MGVVAVRDLDLLGTFRLLSSTRQILDTGDVVHSWGEHPKGFLSYNPDGRFLALVVRDDRPKPATVDAITDFQRIELFRSMTSYGGTYKLVGNSVEHHVDISWNEAWTGTTQIRDIEIDGDRLILSSRPAPFSGDGKMSVVNLVWEKVR